MAEDPLAAVEQVDAAGLFLEQWGRQLQGVDVMDIVRFVRDEPILRGSADSVRAMNAIFTALSVLRSNGGEPLTAGTVKTIPEARNALVSLIASMDVPTANYKAYASESVDGRLLDAKVARGASAAESFGHDAGAPSGALRSRGSAPHTLVSGVGSRMPADPRPAPLARTKGLPVDASETLPDDLIKKWQSEKVEI